MMKSNFGWTVRNFIPDLFVIVKLVEETFRSQILSLFYNC